MPVERAPFDVHGAWARHSVSIDGSVAFETQRVYWLQAGDFYADLRVPFVADAPTSCFSGHSGWDGGRYRWTHELDLAGSDAIDIGELTWDGARLVERGVLGTMPYEEVWVRLPGGDGDAEATASAGACYVRVGDHAITIVDGRARGGSFEASYQVRVGSDWEISATIGPRP